MGWLMAMFDLPVLLDEERKEATRFRNALLDDGFIMIQYSVYSRPCVSMERMKKYYERVKSYAPTTGDIRLLFFTDKQWATSQLVCRRPKRLEKVPEQIEFLRRGRKSFSQNRRHSTNWTRRIIIFCCFRCE